MPWCQALEITVLLINIPPAQIHCHQANAGLDQAASQQDALAPRRGAAAVGRLGIEGRQEAVALADRLRLLVQVEGIAGGPGDVRMSQAFWLKRSRALNWPPVSRSRRSW